MKVYFGRDALRVAAELIALYSPDVCERIATYQVKRLAFRAHPGNAGQIAFWSGVLAHSETLVLREGEPVDVPSSRLFVYKLLERRSAPQAVARVA